MSLTLKKKYNPLTVNLTGGIETVSLKVDAGKQFQAIDGFGVNINPQCWEEGELVPVMELFHNDLEVALYRLDVYGQSDWIDPDSSYDSSILNEDTYQRVYTSAPFQNTWAMCKYLNANGIKPYLNASGVVPTWMCTEDGVTLKDYNSFSEMMASMLHWARHKEGIAFELFGPLNETDLGPPEGPYVNGAEYARCMEVLVEVLDRWGLGDVKLVVAEQAIFNLNYIRPLLASEMLKGRIHVIGMHDYVDHPVSVVPPEIEAYDIVEKPRFWMTEYGDLDATGEVEWEVAWKSAHRLIMYLREGAQAGLVWDAFDNFHDHDKAWSMYGLIRRSRHEYTPKKRYYAAKQVYKFIRPGSVRITSAAGDDRIYAEAFLHESEGVTITGLNRSDQAVLLKVCGSGLPEWHLNGYVTTEELNCVYSGLYANSSGCWNVLLPAKSIFTLTQKVCDHETEK